MNKNKSHSSKIEFFRSFFWRKPRLEKIISVLSDLYSKLNWVINFKNQNPKVWIWYLRCWKIWICQDDFVPMSHTWNSVEQFRRQNFGNSLQTSHSFLPEFKYELICKVKKKRLTAVQTDYWILNCRFFTFQRFTLFWYWFK